MRRHCSDRRIVALAMGYGNGSKHLAECPACQTRLDAWRRTLATASALPTPAAPEASDVWRRLSPALDHPLRPAAMPRRAWALALAACAAFIVFWFARPQRLAAPSQVPASVAAPAVSPLLRAVVTDHLDRTQVLLVELEHANLDPHQRVNLRLEKSTARDLLAANRLYHQSASAQGDAMVAHVLGALEPALIEIAHSPNQATPAEWRQMQHRIASSGVLFKVRVLDQSLRTENGAL